MPTHGWLNDPCGLGYDPRTRLYHVSFQWNFKGAHWGDIVWGKATSPDMVSWTVSPEPCLVRDAPYDAAGVFTGCLLATAIDGTEDGALTYVYTAVSLLPIHYTLPYTVGSEKLALATSHDGGKTWTKQSCNPIISGPPDGVQVTGWRDPYVAPWPAMRDALGLQHDILFGCISGGIVGDTPTAFLYAVSVTDLTSWRYLCPLMRVGLNFSPSRWSGDLGVNWEVVNFVSLTDDDGAAHDFLLLGAEGCKGRYAQSTSKRAERASLWLAGRILAQSETGSSSPRLEYEYSGVLDHGLYYSANSFWDPLVQQQVVFGWITEEDLPTELQERQGWSGCLSLPRTVSVLTLRNVLRSRASNLASITSLQADAKEDGTYTVRTLGIAADPRLQQLRTGAAEATLSALPLTPLGLPNDHVALRTLRWECRCEFAVSHLCKRVGFAIRHSTDCASRTALYWIPSAEEFVVERPDLVLNDSSMTFQTEQAPHTLFTFRDPIAGEETEESLRVHAFCDGNVLEIFVNDRTVLSTRWYTQDARCVGLRFFAEAFEGSADCPAVLASCTIWDGLAARVK